MNKPIEIFDDMTLSSLQLEAFYEVAIQLSFSKAARVLHISQPALSQRILNLEDELKLTLFHRLGKRICLTEAGQILLQFCSERAALESDALRALKERTHAIAGHVHVTGFSTFIRSVLLPQLADISRRHSAVQFSVSCHEIRDIEPLLVSGQTSFAFTTEAPTTPAISSQLIAHEENIMIEPRHHKITRNIFIDHDDKDRTTAQFFYQQEQTYPAYQRIFCDEIYTIIDAVSCGMGRAIVPKHLIKERTDLVIVDGFSPLRIPIYFCYLNKNYFTTLEQYLIQVFQKWSPRLQ